MDNLETILKSQKKYQLSTAADLKIQLRLRTLMLSKQVKNIRPMPGEVVMTESEERVKPIV